MTVWAAEEHESEATSDASSDAFQVVTYRNWLFRSFLPNEEDDADTLGFELVTGWGMGNFNVTSIAYIELADYPRGVP